MFRLTFRTKLILTMTLLVLGLTLMTFRSTRREVREAYSTMLQARFRSQIEYFTEQQQQRQEIIARRCEDLAADPVLASAIRSNGLDSAVGYLAGQVSNLVDTVWGLEADTVQTNAPPPRPPTWEERRRSMERGVVPRLTEQPFVAVLDVDGFLLGSSMPRPPQRPPGGSFRPIQVKGKGPQRSDGPPPTTERERFRWFEDRFRKFVTTERQLVGFTALSTPQGEQQLREVILTPVKAELSDAPPGLLMVAYPLPNFAERSLTNFVQTLDAAPRIFSGVWFDARVFSKSIPTNAWTELSARIGRRVEDGGGTRGAFEVKLNGGSFELVYTVLNPDSPLPKAVQFALFSLEPFEEDVRDLMVQIAIYHLNALFFAVLSSFLVSHNFSGPIRQLSAATGRIRSGDFTVRIPVRSRDDVGELVESFNDMVSGLEHRERLRVALNLVADRDVAEQMASGKIELGGEIRRVSVLFCDIRGFTAMTQGHNPAAVVHLLNVHMSAMTRVVAAHGGVVDKFIGDSIMAVFGAPKSRGNDALNAARCALEMIAARRDLNAAEQTSIEVGIGIATGDVLAGNMGSVERMNYTVIGERVNLASRLCSQAGSAEVLVDDGTRAQLGEGVEAEPLPGLQLKGFTDGVSAYRLKTVRA